MGKYQCKNCGIEFENGEEVLFMKSNPNILFCDYMCFGDYTKDTYCKRWKVDEVD